MPFMYQEKNSVLATLSDTSTFLGGKERERETRILRGMSKPQSIKINMKKCHLQGLTNTDAMPRMPYTKEVSKLPLLAKYGRRTSQEPSADLC